MFILLITVAVNAPSLRFEKMVSKLGEGGRGTGEIGRMT
jgi:hypothetical protein